MFVVRQVSPRPKYTACCGVVTVRFLGEIIDAGLCNVRLRPAAAVDAVLAQRSDEPSGILTAVRDTRAGSYN